MDQLEGTFKQTIAEEQPPSPASSASTKLGDTISIKSLGSMTDHDATKAVGNLKESRFSSASLVDFFAESAGSSPTASIPPDETGSGSAKPDINVVRKAFWSRKNRFIFPRSRGFPFLGRKRSSNAPKLGAVVSLAALAAGMTSMPIVQDPKEDQHVEKAVEDVADEPETRMEIQEQVEIPGIPENPDPEEVNFSNVSADDEREETMEEQEEQADDDELSILTHKLEHEMDELAKLEEEVVKATQQRCSSTENIPSSELVTKNKRKMTLKSRKKSMSDKHLDKLLVLNHGDETWL